MKIKRRMEPVMEMINDSLNTRTLAQYKNRWNHWEKYCHEQQISSYQATPQQVMQYFIELDTGLSHTYTSLSSISFFYRREGLVSPCDDPRVKMFMKGLKRRSSLTKVKRARPMTLAILRKAVHLLTEDATLVTWRTVWRMMICFTCFLRWDDIQRLTIEHLSLRRNSQGWFYHLQLQGGKTNQYNAPDFRVISANGTFLCPFKLTMRYLKRLGKQHSGSLQPTCSPVNKEKPHPMRAVSYSLALMDMRTILNGLGYDGSTFGEHSYRRGAATHSANIGISDGEIQVAGSWLSTKSMNLYIDRQAQHYQNITAKMFSEKS